MCSKYVSTLTIAGCSVVTAVTAQDTTGVRSVEDMSADLVARQLRAVMCDIRPSAIKTGMLGDADVVAAIADTLSSFPRVPLVVDPIIAATSGDSLMQQGTCCRCLSTGSSRLQVCLPQIFRKQRHWQV